MMHFFIFYFMNDIFVILGCKRQNCDHNGRLVGYINQIKILDGIFKIERVKYSS